jgi:hypothetical protein
VAGTERRPVKDDAKHVDDDDDDDDEDDEDDGIEEVESRYTGRRAPGTESVPTVHASAHHGALFTDGTESVPTVHLTMVPKCARDGAEAVARDGAEAVARDGAEAAAELSQLQAVDFEVVVVRPLPAPPSATSPSQLTLCMVSDTHGYEVQGGRMPAADVLVHCGDWCNRYEPHPAQRKPWTCLACKRSPRRPVPHRYESHPLKGSLAKLDEWLASDRCSHIGLKIVLPCMHALTTAPPFSTGAPTSASRLCCEATTTRPPSGAVAAIARCPGVARCSSAIVPDPRSSRSGASRC